MQNDDHDLDVTDIAEDLRITKTIGRNMGGGTWVIGNVAYPLMWW